MSIFIQRVMNKRLFVFRTKLVSRNKFYSSPVKSIPKHYLGHSERPILGMQLESVHADLDLMGLQSVATYRRVEHRHVGELLSSLLVIKGYK